TVTVTNVTNAAQTFNLTVSQPGTATARFTVSPATLMIAANGTATFTVTVSARNVTLNGPLKDFDGDAVVTGATGPSMQLPLWARLKRIFRRSAAALEGTGAPACPTSSCAAAKRLRRFARDRSVVPAR